MQASELLELRVDPLPEGFPVDDITQAIATASPQATGFAEETDANTGERRLLAWFDAATTPPGATDAVAHALCGLGLARECIHWRKLEATDWSEAWQANWRAMPVGRRLWVRPSFRAAAPAGRLDIVLDPGMAFGTGQHETTRLCLEAIERIMDQSGAQTMLDMGAGSGILAIAALKLGCRRALAIDNAPEAVAACRENAAINGVALEVRLADAPPAQRFDLVVANILAGPLIAMAAPLADCVGRHLVLSGLLESQADAVAGAYARAGLAPMECRQMGEWVALAFSVPG